MATEMVYASFYDGTGTEYYMPVVVLGDITDIPTSQSTTPLIDLGLATQGGGTYKVKGRVYTRPHATPAYDDEIKNVAPNKTLYSSYGTGGHGQYYISNTPDLTTWTMFRADGGSPYVSFDNRTFMYDTVNHVWLAIAEISGNRVFGFYIQGTDTYPDHAKVEAFVYQTETNASLNKIMSELTFKPGKGSKGFRPIANRTKNVIGGGNRTEQKPGYTTDVLTQPTAPDETHASAIGTGFINIYKVDSANLARLGKCLFDGLFAKLNNVFISPMDYIVSLQVFPCTPDLGSVEYIKVLQYTAIAADLSEDSQGTKLSKQFKQYDFGTLSIPEMWESFLDYDATSFTLYLPFIGSVDIPVNEVMNGSINVKYTVDFLTGMCVANVLCTKNDILSDDSVVTQYAQHSYMGNCSVTVPLCNESFSNIVGALATAAATCFTGGLGAAAGSLAMAGASGGFKPTVETKGAISSNAGFCAVLQPYITVTRPIPAESDNYQEVIGYPSYIDAILGTCEGLCVCDNIELSGLSGATDSEIARIKQMCKEGVYI